MSASRRIAVIGSGLAGLAAACTLAGRGHRVVVFERRPVAGGGARGFVEGRFHFETRPAPFTWPGVLKRIFAEAGERLGDHLETRRLDPMIRAIYPDGSILDLPGMPASPFQTAPGTPPPPFSAQAFAEFTHWSLSIAQLTERLFCWKPIGGLPDMLGCTRWWLPSAWGEVCKLRGGGSIDALLRKAIPGNPALRRLLAHLAQPEDGRGAGAASLRCGIAHLQLREGICHAGGGPGAVARALSQLAEALGVDMRLGVEVKKILIGRQNKGRAVYALQTDRGETLQFTAVISNAGVARTYERLLAGQLPAMPLQNQRFDAAPPASALLHLGLDRRYGHLLQHNFLFPPAPGQAAEPRPGPMPACALPVCYVHAPAADEPGVAPLQGEALSVCVPWPAHTADTPPARAAMRRAILHQLKTLGAMPDIEERIVLERLRISSSKPLPGLPQGPFHPANRCRLLHDLYFAGGGAHPGPGTALNLMSGWIAADCLDNDHGEFQPSPDCLAYQLSDTDA